MRSALVDTITVCILPSMTMRRRCRFGFHERLVRWNENEREWPNDFFLPVIAQIAMISLPLSLYTLVLFYLI